MDMIIFPIKFNQFGFKILAYICKYDLQIVKNFFCKYSSSIFGNKDQMDMEHKYTMSACTNIIDIFHRPTIIDIWKSGKVSSSG